MVSQVQPQEETQETLRKKQSLLYSEVLEAGGTAHHAEPHGCQGGEGAKTGAGRRFRPESLWGFPGKGEAEQGNSLGLASLNIFQGLWATIA